MTDPRGQAHLMPRANYKPTKGQWFKPPPCIHCGRRRARIGFDGVIKHERNIERIARDGHKQARFCTLQCSLEYALEHAGDTTWCYDCGEWIRSRFCKHLAEARRAAVQ